VSLDAAAADESAHPLHVDEVAEPEPEPTPLPPVQDAEPAHVEDHVENRDFVWGR